MIFIVDTTSFFFYNDKRGRVTIGVLSNTNLLFKNNKNHVLQIRTTMSWHGFDMLQHVKSQHLDRYSMPRHRKIMSWHIALRNLYDAGSCRNMPKPCLACSSALFIFSAFGHILFSLWSFYSSITYKIKIICKSSQNGNKQEKNNKYKRVKIYV